MNYRDLLASVILLAVLDISLAERPIHIEINNFSCIAYRPELTHEFSCTLHRKRVLPSMSVRFNLKETANAFNIICSWGFFKRGVAIDFKNLTVDGCKVLSAFYSNVNIVGKFYKRLRTFGNLPKSCPVPGNTLFEIRNYTVSTQEYPPHVPAISHYFEMKIEYKNTIIASVYVRGRISY